MTTTNDIPVLRVVARLAALGRLDPRSARRPPARLTTLLRRTVEHTPHDLASVLFGSAPPPPRQPATRYALALLELFDAVDALSPRRLTGSIERIRGAFDALAVAAGSPPPCDAARTRVVEEAFLWKAAELYRHLSTDEHVALAEAHVALAGEGHLPTGYASMRAAAFLAEHATSLPDYERAARYATLALRWGADDHVAFVHQLADCITILRLAGEHEQVVELGPPLLTPYEHFDAVDPESLQPHEAFTAFAAQVGVDIAMSWAELGSPHAAMPFAADALWRSLRRFGPDDAISMACQHALAQHLFELGRPDDAVAMLQPVFDCLRDRIGDSPRDYVYTGIALALGLDRVGRRTEAHAVSAEVATFTARRMSRQDQAFRDAQATLRLIESRA